MILAIIIVEREYIPHAIDFVLLDHTHIINALIGKMTSYKLGIFLYFERSFKPIVSCVCFSPLGY